MLSEFLEKNSGAVWAVMGIVLFFCIMVFMPMLFTYMSEGDMRP